MWYDPWNASGVTRPSARFRFSRSRPLLVSFWRRAFQARSVRKVYCPSSRVRLPFASSEQRGLSNERSYAGRDQGLVHKPRDAIRGSWQVLWPATRGSGGVDARVTWRQKCEILKLFLSFITLPLICTVYAVVTRGKIWCTRALFQILRREILLGPSTAESLNPNYTHVRQLRY